jgi:hypothetical protein
LAFLRFSRDKRGYEHFYLVEATTNRRGKTRARVLYWFRTPPGVKVGREPFDATVRQLLESQNPGVVFDWRKILETPIPSADAERWRERRRAEKAEKAARRARGGGEEGEQDEREDEIDQPSERPARVDPREPPEPREPDEPGEPREPQQPREPPEPAAPPEPFAPAEPREPREPIEPDQPVEPRIVGEDE